LFLQIVILTEWDLRHESLTLIIIYLKSAVFPTFVKLCVCASHVTSPVFWHGLDLPLAIFIHCSLAKRISMCFRMNQELYEYVGGKLGEVDIVRFILCSVPVKRVKTKLLGSLIFKLC